MSRIVANLLRKPRRRASHDADASHDASGRAAPPSAAVAEPPPTLFAAELPAARLQRLALWSTTGRAPAAELELFTWQRDDDCPAAAIIMLAGLWWRRGETRAARDLLVRHAERHAADTNNASDANATNDPSGAMLLQCAIAALLTDDRPEQSSIDRARRLTRILHREHGGDPAVDAWLDLVSPPGVDALSAASSAAAEHLAGELLSEPQVIPSLVAAQKLSPDEPTIALLRQAAGLLFRDADEPRQCVTLCHALAELALLAGDHDDARRWAHRGLRVDPYHASLALILARFEDDAALGPPASQALTNALSRHPRYADVRAALIRREFADGRTDAARRRLRQWLRREPNQRLAVELEREIAA